MPEDKIKTLVELRAAIGDIIDERAKWCMPYDVVGDAADSILELLFENFSEIKRMLLG